MPNLVQKICTKNDCVKQGRKLEGLKYLIVHSPGVYPAIVRAASGKNPWCDRWNKAGVEKMVHGVIDNTGAYQTAPLDLACWQVGNHEGNYNSIGFELCELETQAEFQKVWNNAVQVYADLCREHNMSVSQIYGHYEAHSAGFASNHADPKPYFSRFGKTMNDFRADVQTVLNGEAEKPASSVIVNEIFSPWKYAKVCSLTVDDPYLNVRTGAGIQYEVLRQLANGNEVDVLETYTNGWAKINITGQIGYVNTHWLDMGSSQAVPEAEESKGNTYQVGKVYTLQTNLKVRTGPGTSYRQKQRSELTADGQKSAKAGTMATLKKGTKVTAKEIQMDLSGNTWLRAPSGWLCAIYQGNVYIV